MGRGLDDPSKGTLNVGGKAWVRRFAFKGVAELPRCVQHPALRLGVRQSESAVRFEADAPGELAPVC